jgi:DNA-nicking Smr family endonuclease
MDFGDILDAWEKKRGRSRSEGTEAMDELISRYPPDKDSGRQDAPEGAKQDIESMEPQAVLDLHGMNSREAEQALERFIYQARSRGVKKVLIVHGKGNHSQGEPVLQGVVRRYLEKCPYTGAFASAKRKHGGRGATWVIVRASMR